MYNPWSGYRVTGTWEDHASYSDGGTDWPLAYGSALRAPATGRLVNNGWAGSAGRRATLYFDAPVRRVAPASPTPMYGDAVPYFEHSCDMVAFVFQHAKGYLGDGRYAEGALIGYSGASANGSDWGGEVHLHGHGQCIHWARVDFMKFLGSTTAGGGVKPIGEPIEEEVMQQAYVIVKREDAPLFAVVGAGARVGTIVSGAALRGVKKIIAGFRVDSDEPVEVTLSGEEWDAGTLDCFR